MSQQQERPFRNSHWTGALSDPGVRIYTRHYRTREQAVADADVMAGDGENVALEEWDADLASDPINQGWALYGNRPSTRDEEQS